MSNFTVTVTEILGTDSMNNSRITINNNFSALATSVNEILKVVDIESASTTIGGTGVNFNGNNATFQNNVSATTLTLGNITIDQSQLDALLKNLLH